MTKGKTDNKKIAKNTIFLYFRMMCTMLISLYTSRIILEKLGVNDFGIYQAVGGIVGFLSFINSALSNGSSRFLTYVLGENNLEKLRKTFSTTLTIHIALALIIVLISETFGLWFLFNKMVIPEGKMYSAFWVYQISILTAFFTLTQVPYNASIIAHENMSIYAYVSIIEVSLKLGICYLLSLVDFNRLIFYAVLLCSIQVGLMVFYRIYCTKNYSETRYSPKLYDKKLLKEIATFSGWSLFANGSIALNSQGILILLNMFFSPAVVSARAISLQVNNAANQFVNNFRTAANPQIVKLYATQEYDKSKMLLLSSTKYSYYLMWLLCLPICLLANPLLHLWLTVVPEYTTIFLQLIVIQSLFQVFDTSFYTALYAKGQLKQNALISPLFGFVRFPIVYLLFKAGYSPVALSWASLISYAILGLIVKPILVIKIVDYTWKDIISVILPCFKVTMVSLPLPIITSLYFDTSKIFGFILVCVICAICNITAVWFLGLDQDLRIKICEMAKSKLKWKKYY